ncbi:MAG TPA: hypothetical protein VIX85_12230 [Acidimicrobiales bacterium]
MEREATGDQGVTLDAGTTAAALHCRAQRLAQPIQAEQTWDPDIAFTLAQAFLVDRTPAGSAADTDACPPSTSCA